MINTVIKCSRDSDGDCDKIQKVQSRFDENREEMMKSEPRRLSSVVHKTTLTFIVSREVALRLQETEKISDKGFEYLSQGAVG